MEAYGRRYRTRIGEWVNAEAAWSPDSSAFFVTYSDGGLVGTYHVKVFYVTAAALRRSSTRSAAAAVVLSLVLRSGNTERRRSQAGAVGRVSRFMTPNARNNQSTTFMLS